MRHILAAWQLDSFLRISSKGHRLWKQNRKSIKHLTILAGYNVDTSWEDISSHLPWLGVLTFHYLSITFPDCCQYLGIKYIKERGKFPFLVFWGFFFFFLLLTSKMIFFSIFKTIILNNVYFAFKMFLFNSNYNQFLQSYFIDIILILKRTLWDRVLYFSIKLLLKRCF